jgi:hypothetical protein
VGFPLQSLARQLKTAYIIKKMNREVEKVKNKKNLYKLPVSGYKSKKIQPIIILTGKNILKID